MQGECQAAGASACPGKVETGFPKRTCANQRIGGLFRMPNRRASDGCFTGIDGYFETAASAPGSGICPCPPGGAAGRRQWPADCKFEEKCRRIAGTFCGVALRPSASNPIRQRRDRCNTHYRARRPVHRKGRRNGVCSPGLRLARCSRPAVCSWPRPPPRKRRWPCCCRVASTTRAGTRPAMPA